MSEPDKRPHCAAILTGSHAYGTPGPDSDVDLVVFANRETREKLFELLGPIDPTKREYPAGDLSLRCGRLNLIVVGDAGHHKEWERGTAQLVARRPVTRAEAVEHLDQVFGRNPHGFPLKASVDGDELVEAMGRGKAIRVQGEEVTS